MQRLDPADEPLTRLDLDSPTWSKLMARWQRRLDALREQNDAPFAPDQEYRANVIRGRIAELKDLLALGQPAEPLEMEDEPE